MKYYFAFILTALFCSAEVGAQNNAAVVATHIAQKMKDTLSLSDGVKQQLYTINMQLHQQKMIMRQQYAGNTDSATRHIQKIENTRDSLYHTVLTDSQYQLYKQKKRNLVSSN